MSGERGWNGVPQLGLGVGLDRSPGGLHTSGDPWGHHRGPQARSTARRWLPLTLSSHNTGPAGAGGGKEGTGARSPLPEHRRGMEAEPATAGSLPQAWA